MTNEEKRQRLVDLMTSTLSKAMAIRVMDSSMKEELVKAQEGGDPIKMLVAAAAGRAWLEAREKEIQTLEAEKAEMDLLAVELGWITPEQLETINGSARDWNAELMK